jgi:rubrerythrin
MKIKKITSMHRRDFSAIFVCEHCEYEHERDGYDDGYFHREVIPKMECPTCGKKAADDYQPMGTRYPDGMQV